MTPLRDLFRQLRCTRRLQRVAPRRMIRVGVHATAGRMNDHRTALPGGVQDLVHSRGHLLHSPDCIQAMMRIPHIANDERRLLALPGLRTLHHVEAPRLLGRFLSRTQLPMEFIGMQARRRAQPTRQHEKTNALSCGPEAKRLGDHALAPTWTEACESSLLYMRRVGTGWRGASLARDKPGRGGKTRWGWLARSIARPGQARAWREDALGLVGEEHRSPGTSPGVAGRRVGAGWRGASLARDKPGRGGKTRWERVGEEHQLARDKPRRGGKTRWDGLARSNARPGQAPGVAGRQRWDGLGVEHRSPGTSPGVAGDRVGKRVGEEHRSPGTSRVQRSATLGSGPATRNQSRKGRPQTQPRSSRRTAASTGTARPSCT